MYKPFSSFVLRTPMYPFSYQCNLDKQENKQIQEAIYIASPVLYTESQKLLNGEIKEVSAKARINYSLHRYFSRMTTRCTPFGLFAGCSTGKITGEKTNIILEVDFKRSTRLDMFYLCTLSQELSKLPEIRDRVKYYPNTTIYGVGNKYRYIEYHYIKSKRIHRISSVDCSDYLDAILKQAKNGVRINDLLAYLIDNEIQSDNALDFIHEMIDSQIIVSELTPSVTGEDFLNRIIRILDILNINVVIRQPLKEIQKLLFQLDSNQENSLELYRKIIDQIEKLKIPHEEKFLFQVDMIKNVTEATIGSEIMNELQSVKSFLNKITMPRKHETLTKFQQTFYERYEEREVSLMEVLDPELGIGYPVKTNSRDMNPLLDDFLLPEQTNQEITFQTNAFQSILLKKTINALSQNKQEIVFTDDDVKNFKENWDDLPPTIYCLFEIIKENQTDTLIRINALGGSCGANLLTRLAHTDAEIEQLIKEIASKEQELMPNVIFAEIAHLPDSRVGNILYRPHIRDYEILYLASPDLQHEQLIYMSDLTISIRQGRIYLRSQKLNKEIIPRLTNAHNYRSNPMPVYHFLCDMQIQRGRGSLYFDWGHIGKELAFRPRVRYKNTLLSLATWVVKIEEIKHLFFVKDDNLITEAKKWRNSISLPQCVLLQDGDNELFVDWENVISIQALFAIIKQRQTVQFSEFIFEAKNAIVKDNDGNTYLNECIVVFHKSENK